MPAALRWEIHRWTTGFDNTLTIFSGVISGANSGLTKAGSGTLTLTGNNTYTGATIVSAGGLTLNRSGGAVADTTAVTVAAGATLTLSQKPRPSAAGRSGYAGSRSQYADGRR